MTRFIALLALPFASLAAQQPREIARIIVSPASRTMIAGDVRGVPARHGPANEAHFIAPSDEWLLWYLRQIYVDSDATDVQCIRHAPGATERRLAVCKDHGAPCVETAIVRMPLRR